MSGFTALLFSGVIYSTFGILIRFASESFGTFWQVFARCAATAVIALSVVVIRRSRLVLPRVPLPLIVFFLLSPVLGITFITISIQSMKAANAIFGIYVGYILAMLMLGIFWYRERVTWGKAGALFFVLIGAFLFAYPFTSTSLFGMAFAMLAGAMDGVSGATCKALGKYDKNVLLFYRYSVGLMLALLVAGIVGEPMPTAVTVGSGVSIVFLGASIFAIDSLWLYGFSHFDLNMGSILTSVELLIVPWLNALVLKEIPTTLEILGGAFIFTAIMVVHLVSNKRNDEESR